MKKQIAIGVFAILLTTAFSLQTRISGPMRFNGSGEGPPVMILRDARVQQELKLSKDQQGKLEKLAPKPGTPIKTDGLESIYSKVKGVLTSSQIHRLEEIHRQRSGIYSATYAPYAKQLGLSEAVRTKMIAAYSEGMMKAVSAQMANIKPGGAPVRISMGAKESLAARKEFEAKARPMLTSAQWAKWKTMLGKPFGGK